VARKPRGINRGTRKRIPQLPELPGKPGRPPLLNPDQKTLDTIRGLGQIFATTIECAAVLGVAEPRFMEFLARQPLAREAYDRGYLVGKISLRRKQLKLADKHPAMAIFLGKNYLDQHDRQHLTGDILTWDLSRLSEKQMDVLESLISQVEATAAKQIIADYRRVA
jgi:hypothetical protein